MLTAVELHVYHRMVDLHMHACHRYNAYIEHDFPISSCSSIVLLHNCLFGLTLTL
jgi:hypothetical protein